MPGTNNICRSHWASILEKTFFLRKTVFPLACACFNLITLHFQKRWKNFVQKAELKACLKPKFFETDCLLQFYGFLVESPERCSDGFQICLNLRNNFFSNCSYYTHAFVTIQGQIAQSILTNYANRVQYRYKK